MSTYAPTSAVSLSSAGSASGVYQPKSRSREARGLSAMLLAAVVAALVVVADRVIDGWADGHLLMAWVMLWVVVFAGSALFAGTARKIATRTLSGLDNWSKSIAETRAQARMWDLARKDPALMNELMAAQGRDDNDFSDALAPLSADVLGDAPVVTGTRWERFVTALGESRTRNMHLYYV